MRLVLAGLRIRHAGALGALVVLGLGLGPRAARAGLLGDTGGREPITAGGRDVRRPAGTANDLGDRPACTLDNRMCAALVAPAIRSTAGDAPGGGALARLLLVLGLALTGLVVRRRRRASQERRLARLGWLDTTDGATPRHGVPRGR